MRRNHPESGDEMQKGASADPMNLKFWSDRASANSYHGEKTKRPVKGKAYPLNDDGSTFMPNVRRAP